MSSNLTREANMLSSFNRIGLWSTKPTMSVRIRPRVRKNIRAYLLALIRRRKSSRLHVGSIPTARTKESMSSRTADMLFRSYVCPMRNLTQHIEILFILAHGVMVTSLTLNQKFMVRIHVGQQHHWFYMPMV